MPAVRDVYVVRTGLANLASIQAGLRRAGAEPHITENPDDVARATHVLLPGVGAFGAAMEHLNACGLTKALQERLRAGRPTMCVCVGHQLLCEESEEDPGVPGLGIVPHRARRLPREVRVPQLGWNIVTPDAGCTRLEKGYAYYANSFCIDKAPQGWSAAWSEHGIPFVAAMEKGKVLTCQFHPELSGPYGLALVKRWLETEDEEDCGC